MSGLFDTVEPASGLVVVKCLSLWEPWASLMACGAKRNETRSWPTSYRGPLLICASKKRIPELGDILREREFKEALRRPEDRVLGDIVDRLAFGMAVAVVDLVDCVPVERAPVETPTERAFGDYTPGRWAWVTKRTRRVDPFPVTGHQGLWNEAVQSWRIHK